MDRGIYAHAVMKYRFLQESTLPFLSANIDEYQ